MAKPTSNDFDKGLALHQQGRLTEAEPLYRRVLRTAPKNFDALHLLGVLCGQTDRFDEAYALLTQALAQRPDSAPALNNLGNTLGSLGRHQEAVQAFERALAVRPEDAKALRNRGTSLRALERPVEALASFDAALALQPDYADALIGRAESLLTLHRRSQAIATFQQVLALGKEVDQVRYTLASLGVGDAPTTAPADYVAALFDTYSHTFDEHLVQRLGYRTPELLVAELQRANPPSGVDVIDLGCGTGLCGPLLKPYVRRLEGVDLSANMLALARQRGLYDELAQAELVAYLQLANPASYDLVVSADTLCYFGRLEAAFAAVRRALRPGGHWVFTVEAMKDGDEPFHLQPHGRYSHARAYVEEALAGAGFAHVELREVVLRMESKAPVAGWLTAAW